MKKLSYIIILIFFALKLNSQNIETEIKYLKNINTQSKELVKDNLRNAEICAYKIIQNPDSIRTSANIFFNELAKSYFISENYEFVILSYLRQRCFFPKKEDAEVFKYYNNASERIKNADNSLLSQVFKNTEYTKIPKSLNNRYLLFLKTIYQISFDDASDFETIYSDLYINSKKEKDIPYWIKQHNFYSKIGIKPKDRKSFYSFTKNENNFFIPTFLSKKEKKKICNKTLKYYIHLKNEIKVKEYINFCEENNIKYCFRAKLIR